MSCAVVYQMAMYSCSYMHRLAVGMSTRNVVSKNGPKGMPLIVEQSSDILAYIACFCHTQNVVLSKMLHEEKLPKWRKDFLQIVPTISLWELYDAHSKKHAQLTPSKVPSPTIRTLL